MSEKLALLLLLSIPYFPPNTHVHRCDVLELNHVQHETSTFHQLVFWRFIDGDFHVVGWTQAYEKYPLPTRSPLTIGTHTIHFISSMETLTHWDRELEDQHFLPATQRPSPINVPRIYPPPKQEPPDA